MVVFVIAIGYLTSTNLVDFMTDAFDQIVKVKIYLIIFTAINIENTSKHYLECAYYLEIAFKLFIFHIPKANEDTIVITDS